MKNKFLITLALATLTSCAIDSPATPAPDLDNVETDTYDPVLDDGGVQAAINCGNRPVTKQIGTPEFQAALPPGTFARTYAPTFIKLGSWDAPAMHQDLQGTRAPGIASNGSSYAAALTIIPADSGDKIIGVSWSGCGDGDVDIAGSVWIAPSYPALTTALGGSVEWHGTGVDFNHPDLWDSFTIPNFHPKVIQPGEFVGLYFTAYGPGYVVGGVTVTFERAP